MLLLTASYGHDCWTKVWLSFRAEENYDADAFSYVAGNFGCQEQFANKAAALLTTSGRYDCCVQQAWANSRFRTLCFEMEAVGVSVIIDPSYAPPNLTKSGHLTSRI